MTEYIDREAAIEAAKHAWAKGLEPSQYIETIPTADVEPVVRCKECKHAYINSFSVASGVALCRLLTKRAEGIRIVMQQDDFCSYGEREEGAHNG